MANIFWSVVWFIIGHIGLFFRLSMKAWKSQDFTLGTIIAHIKRESGFAFLSWLFYLTLIALWVGTDWLDMAFRWGMSVVGMLVKVPKEFTLFPIGELNPLTVLFGLLADINLLRQVLLAISKKGGDKIREYRGKAREEAPQDGGGTTP